jgi:hypothetical protein
MKIGIVSDTHNVIPNILHTLFIGVELLIHAGDLEDPHILPELNALAPNVARVAGNCCRFEHPRAPEHLIFEQFGLKFFVVHNLLFPNRLSSYNASIIQHHQPDVIVFGHTHRPLIDLINGSLFINPGQTGKGSAPNRTAALLTIESETLTCQIFRLFEKTYQLDSQLVFASRKDQPSGARIAYLTT